jgi:hypothetical protein
MENEEIKNEEYTNGIEEKSTTLARSLIKKLADRADDLIIPRYEKLSPVEKGILQEKSTDFSIDFMKEITESGIDYPYASRCINKIKVFLETLQMYIDGSINQYEHEFKSRSLGVKDENGRYTAEKASVATLLLKLEEMRNSQGNKSEEYFIFSETAEEVKTEELSTEKVETEVVAETKEDVV